MRRNFCRTARHDLVLAAVPPQLQRVIKHLAHDLACRNGRPGRWTLDDLEGARLLANRRITDHTQTRTPEQRLAERLTITDRDRDQLAASVCTARTLRCAQLTVVTGKQQRSITADALERQAIADVLQNIGILTIRSSRVRLPNQES